MVIVRDIPVMIFGKKIHQFPQKSISQAQFLFYLLKFNTNQNGKKGNMLINGAELCLSKCQNVKYFQRTLMPFAVGRGTEPLHLDFR